MRIFWIGVGVSVLGCVMEPPGPVERQGYHAATTLAREALAAGADVADLDGDGRNEYSRTRDAQGRVLTEAIDIDGSGEPELTWDHREEVKRFRLDVDHDGVAERAIDVRFDVERPEVASYVISEDTTGNRIPDERRSFTIDPALDTIEVVVERDSEEVGDFIETSRRSLPRVSEQRAEGSAPDVQTDPSTAGHCEPEVASQLQAAFESAIDDGLACLGSVSMEFVDEALRALSVARIEVRCVTQQSAVCASVDEAFLAQLFRPQPSFQVPVLPINVNPDRGPNCGSLQRTLFHELMHYVVGPHANNSRSAEWDETDRAYGCERMCFGCSGADCGVMPVHKDACSQCLGLAVSDRRCDGLEPADDGEGNEGGAGGKGGAGGEGGAGGSDGAPACVGSPEFCGPFNQSPASPWGGATSTPGGGEEGTGGQTQGAIVGDPHLVTLDGVMYDFQAVGEFVLVDDAGGFTVQVRQAPFGDSESISVVTALATQIGATRIGFYSDELPPLRLDGVPLELEAGLMLDGGGSIEHAAGNYKLTWPTGEALDVRVTPRMLDAIVSIPRERARPVRGLLGNGNGNSEDDFVLADGSVLPRPLLRDVLYGDFASGLRITDEQSLFDYPAGAATADFTDLGFPREILTAAQLPASEYAAGMLACTSNGVRGHDVLEACVLDYSISRDPAVVRGYQGMPTPRSAESLAFYRNGFEGAHDGVLSSALLGRVPPDAPLGDNGHAGPFGGGALTLTTTDLPPHALLTVAFDLYTLGPWDDTPFELAVVNGSTLLRTTFSNAERAQAFPDFAGVATHPARTGAVLVNALGSPGSARQDAIYHLRFTFVHAEPELSLAFTLPEGLDPTLSFGLDNVEITLDAPPGSSAEDIAGTLVVHGPVGDPVLVGCADGRREALLDADRHPDIAGCLAGWSGIADLRAPATGAPCGDGLGPCAVPADACAAGWHVCADTGLLTELLRLSPDECEDAGGGRYSAAVSHCASQSGCVYADSADDTYPCYPQGWCSEAVCCGSGCLAQGACQSGVWPERTQIAIGPSAGCGAVSSAQAGGVLCCR